MYKSTSQLVNRKIAPKEASSLLTFNNYHGQRPMNEAKARMYSELIKLGKMRHADVCVAVGPDGNRYLLNGQHTLQGCVWSGKELLVVIAYYKCETWNDVAELFASFDTTYSIRTQNHIFIAYRAGYANEKLRDVPLRTLGSCGTALAALQTSVPCFIAKTGDKNVKPKLVENHPSEVLWIASFVDCTFLQKVGAVTAMIATRRKNPAKAELFWRKVQSGLGYATKNDPEKKVREFLIGSANLGNNSRNAHESIYAICISWWNTFVTGDTRNGVKLAVMKDLPKVLS